MKKLELLFNYIMLTCEQFYVMPNVQHAAGFKVSEIIM